MELSPPIDRRERKDVQRNLERVLEAAQDLFTEHGPDLKMEDVARRAGVGIGTIYRRFSNKEKLVAAIRDAACDHTRSCISQAAADAHAPLEKIRAIVTALYHQGVHQGTWPTIAPPDPAHTPPAAAEPANLYATLHAVFTPLISAGQRQGSIKPGDPALLAAICLELLSPDAYRRLTLHLGADNSAAADLVADFVVAGLTLTAATPYTHDEPDAPTGP